MTIKEPYQLNPYLSATESSQDVMADEDRYGFSCIYSSMEQEPCFQSELDGKKQQEMRQ